MENENKWKEGRERARERQTAWDSHPSSIVTSALVFLTLRSLNNTRLEEKHRQSPVSQDYISWIQKFATVFTITTNNIPTTVPVVVGLSLLEAEQCVTVMLLNNFIGIEHGYDCAPTPPTLPMHQTPP